MSKYNGLIQDFTIGKSYEMTVVHIGAAMAHENEDEPLYGGTLRAEYSHTSGSIHVEVTGYTKFWEWLKQNENMLTTQISSGQISSGWKLEKKITHAVLDRLTRAYVKWNERGCPNPLEEQL